MFIEREISARILESARKMPILTISGPRQSGKTTLAKMLFPDYEYYNMELPLTQDLFLSDPVSFFKNLDKGLIIDEFQNLPQILSYIQVISDENPLTGKIILTGSQNYLMLEKISQSLAGRTSIFCLLPLSLSELKGTEYEMSEYENYLLKGFYPRIYKDDLNANQWLTDYINLYLERDIRKIINIRDAAPFGMFMKLCAGRTGQLLNLSAISDLVGMDSKTIRSWISALEAGYIVYLLRPYYNNFNKRITRAPKLYFYDTGLVCALLGIKNENELDSHYLKGQLFENFVMSELIKNNYNKRIGHEFYFWNEQGNNEIDCLIDSGGKLTAIEIKASSSFSHHFLKNIERFRILSGKNFEEGYVIMNIDKSITVKDINLISWKNTDIIL